MSSFIFGMNIGLVIFGLALFLSLFYLTVLILARNNLFFTIVKEGTAKAILRFGEFHRAIMVYKGHKIDKMNYVQHDDVKEKQAWIKNGRLLKDEDIFDPKTAYVIESKETFHWLPGGIRWIGNPFAYSIHTYRFRWDSLKQKVLENGEIVQVTVPHDEVIDYIIVQDDVYATVVKSAETNQMVPLDLLVALTIRVTNPYKALFRVQDWLEQVINLVDPAIREFVGHNKYEDLTKTGGRIQKGTEVEFLQESSIGADIQEDYGIRLKSAGFIRVDPAGKRGEDFVVASTKKYVARQEAAAIRTLANAEAYREEKVYDAVIKRGEPGMAIRTAEAIEKAASTGKASVIPFPASILEALARAFGGAGKSTN